MSNVFIGAGNASGMFYKAPKGTSIPSSPNASLGADWVEVGAITDAGITLALPNGDVLRNWALEPERKLNTENGSVTAPIMYTTKKVLETIFGASNVVHTAATASDGNIETVTISPDVSAEPASYLFLMKDGDALAMLVTNNGLITDISDVSFAPDSSVNWEVKIEGTWTFAIDDGQVTSA